MYEELECEWYFYLQMNNKQYLYNYSIIYYWSRAIWIVLTPKNAEIWILLTFYLAWKKFCEYFFTLVQVFRCFFYVFLAGNLYYSVSALLLLRLQRLVSHTMLQNKTWLFHFHAVLEFWIQPANWNCSIIMLCWGLIANNPENIFSAMFSNIFKVKTNCACYAQVANLRTFWGNNAKDTKLQTHSHRQSIRLRHLIHTWEFCIYPLPFVCLFQSQDTSVWT